MKTPQELAEDILLETYSNYKHYPEDYSGLYHYIKAALQEYGAAEFERAKKESISLVLPDANDLHSIASDSQDRHTNGNAYNAAIEAMNDYEQQLKKLNGVPK